MLGDQDFSTTQAETFKDAELSSRIQDSNKSNQSYGVLANPQGHVNVDGFNGCNFLTFQPSNVSQEEMEAHGYVSVAQIVNGEDVMVYWPRELKSAAVEGVDLPVRWVERKDVAIQTGQEEVVREIEIPSKYNLAKIINNIDKCLDNATPNYQNPPKDYVNFDLKLHKDCPEPHLDLETHPLFQLSEQQRQRNIQIFGQTNDPFPRIQSTAQKELESESLDDEPVGQLVQDILQEPTRHEPRSESYELDEPLQRIAKPVETLERAVDAMEIQMEKEPEDDTMEDVQVEKEVAEKSLGGSRRASSVRRKSVGKKAASKKTPAKKRQVETVEAVEKVVEQPVEQPVDPVIHEPLQQEPLEQDSERPDAPLEDDDTPLPEKEVDESFGVEVNTNNEFICTVDDCGKSFDTSRGMNGHQTLVHSCRRNYPVKQVPNKVYCWVDKCYNFYDNEKLLHDHQNKKHEGKRNPVEIPEQEAPAEIVQQVETVEMQRERVQSLEPKEIQQAEEIQEPGTPLQDKTQESMQVDSEMETVAPTTTKSNRKSLGQELVCTINDCGRVFNSAKAMYGHQDDKHSKCRNYPLNPDPKLFYCWLDKCYKRYTKLSGLHNHQDMVHRGRRAEGPEPIEPVKETPQEEVVMEDAQEPTKATKPVAEPVKRGRGSRAHESTKEPSASPARVRTRSAGPLGFVRDPEYFYCDHKDCKNNLAISFHTQADLDKHMAIHEFEDKKKQSKTPTTNSKGSTKTPSTKTPATTKTPTGKQKTMSASKTKPMDKTPSARPTEEVEKEQVEVEKEVEGEKEVVPEPQIPIQEPNLTQETREMTQSSNQASSPEVPLAAQLVPKRAAAPTSLKEGRQRISVLKSGSKKGQSNNTPTTSDKNKDAPASTPVPQPKVDNVMEVDKPIETPLEIVEPVVEKSLETEEPVDPLVEKEVIVKPVNAKDRRKSMPAKSKGKTIDRRKSAPPAREQRLATPLQRTTRGRKSVASYAESPPTGKRVRGSPSKSKKVVNRKPKSDPVPMSTPEVIIKTRPFSKPVEREPPIEEMPQLPQDIVPETPNVHQTPATPNNRLPSPELEDDEDPLSSMQPTPSNRKRPHDESPEGMSKRPRQAQETLDDDPIVSDNDGTPRSRQPAGKSKLGKGQGKKGGPKTKTITGKQATLIDQAQKKAATGEEDDVNVGRPIETYHKLTDRLKAAGALPKTTPQVEKQTNRKQVDKTPTGVQGPAKDNYYNAGLAKERGKLGTTGTIPVGTRKGTVLTLKKLQDEMSEIGTATPSASEDETDEDEFMPSGLQMEGN